jgi:hypothetical protein
MKIIRMDRYLSYWKKKLQTWAKKSVRNHSEKLFTVIHDRMVFKEINKAICTLL